MAYGKRPGILFGVDDEGGQVGLALGRNPTSHVEDEWHGMLACVGLRFANPTYVLRLSVKVTLPFSPWIE